MISDSEADRADGAPRGGPLATARRAGRAFPALGRDDARPTVTSTSRYFTTVPHLQRSATWREVADRGDQRFHAKELGMSQTLCGMPTWSWTTLWEVPFVPTLRPACPECMLIAAEPS